MKNILFVCTGNTCRSPMAEAICLDLLRKTGKAGRARAASRGLYAAEGEPMAVNAVEALREIGIEAAHTAAQLDGALLAEADLVVCMTEGHRQALLQRWPDCAADIVVLQVPDPFGGDRAAYRACRDRLLRAVEEIVGRV